MCSVVPGFIPCTPMSLPWHFRPAAAFYAVQHNPQNAPRVDHEIHEVLGGPPEPAHLVALTGKKWASGTTLTVDFLEPIAADLRDRILSHMNAWNHPENPDWPHGNLPFVYSKVNPIIRVTLTQSGYWSYCGTDCQMIPEGEPTTCFQDFTMMISEEEYKRVIRHEAGHIRDYPHTHLLRALVERVDPVKAIPYYEKWQGWSEVMIRAQVLTPLEDSAIFGDVNLPDELSIMTYGEPGEITYDGKPIPGGTDINLNDYTLDAKIYGATPTGPIVTPPVIVPPIITPPTPPPPSGGATPLALGGTAAVVKGQPARFAVTMPASGTLRLALRADGGASWASNLLWPVVFHSAKGRDTHVYLSGGQGNLGIDAGSYEFDVWFPLVWQTRTITAQAWSVSAGLAAATGATIAGYVTHG